MEKQTKFFTTNNLLLILVSSIVSIIGTLGVLQGVPILVSETELGRRLNQLEVIPKEPVVSEKLVEARDIPDMVEQVSDAVVSVIVTADVPVVEQYFEEYNPWGDFLVGDLVFQFLAKDKLALRSKRWGEAVDFLCLLMDL